MFGRAVPLRVSIGEGWSRVAYVLNGGAERPVVPALPNVDDWREVGDVYDLREGANEVVLRSYVGGALAGEISLTVYATVAGAPTTSR